MLPEGFFGGEGNSMLHMHEPFQAGLASCGTAGLDPDDAKLVLPHPEEYQ